MSVEIRSRGLPQTAEDWPSAYAVAWRRRQLLTSGFEEVLAARLAADLAVDLHELLTLVDRGCTPRLAARILALSVDSNG